MKSLETRQASRADRIVEKAVTKEDWSSGEAVDRFVFGIRETLFKKIKRAEGRPSEQAAIVLEARNNIHGQSSSEAGQYLGYFNAFNELERSSVVHPLVRLAAYTSREYLRQLAHEEYPEDRDTDTFGMSEEAWFELENEREHNLAVLRRFSHDEELMAGSYLGQTTCSTSSKDSVSLLDRQGNARHILLVKEKPSVGEESLLRAMDIVDGFSNGGGELIVSVHRAGRVRSLIPRIEFDEDLPILSILEAWRHSGNERIRAFVDASVASHNVTEEEWGMAREVKQQTKQYTGDDSVDTDKASRNLTESITGLLPELRRTGFNSATLRILEIAKRVPVQYMAEQYVKVARDMIAREMRERKEVPPDIRLGLTNSTNAESALYDAVEESKKEIHSNFVQDLENVEKLQKETQWLEARRKIIEDGLGDMLLSELKDTEDSAPEVTKMTPEEVVSKYAPGVSDIAMYSRLLHLVNHPDIRKKFEKDFGLDIRDLFLREQVWFLEYLGRTSVEAANRLAKATKKYGVDLARAFLVSEQDERAAEAILNIAERLPEADAKKVFERYGALVSTARKETDELLREFFVDAGGKKVDAQSLEREILRRGKDLIVELGRDISSGGKVDVGVVEVRLNRTREDAVLFSSIFKTAYRGKDTISFHELRTVSFERVDWDELSYDEAETIKKIHWENWSVQSPEEAEDLQRKLEDALEGKGNNQFYVLKRNGEVVAFARTSEEDETGKVLPSGHLYLGSVNVALPYKESSIGEAAVDKMVEDAASHAVLHGIADAKHFIGTMYVERFGAVIEGLNRDTTGKGLDELVLKKDVSLSSQLIGTTLDRNDIVEGRVPEICDVRTFDIVKDYDGYISTIDMWTKGGKIISRYFSEKSNPNIRVMVAEPAPASEIKLPLAA